VSFADAVGLTKIFQRRLFPDKSDIPFSATPGTDDSHARPVSRYSLSKKAKIKAKITPEQ
jgi:hypothetical protein